MSILIFVRDSENVFAAVKLIGKAFEPAAAEVCDAADTAASIDDFKSQSNAVVAVFPTAIVK